MPSTQLPPLEGCLRLRSASGAQDLSTHGTQEVLPEREVRAPAESQGQLGASPLSAGSERRHSGPEGVRDAALPAPPQLQLLPWGCCKLSPAQPCILLPDCPLVWRAPPSYSDCAAGESTVPPPEPQLPRVQPGLREWEGPPYTCETSVGDSLPPAHHGLWLRALLSCLHVRHPPPAWAPPQVPSSGQ